MSNNDIVLEWIRYAKSDLDTANYLIPMYPKPIEIICYHCQQCAEKILKAFLISKDTMPPKIHDLNRLCEMCEELDSGFSDIAKSCAILTKYGVAPKYPSEINIVENDVKAALENAQCVCDKVSLLLM